MNVMKISRVLLTLLMAGGLVAIVSACEKKGKMEKAGESVDNAIEDAGQSIEEAGDEAKKRTSK